MMNEIPRKRRMEQGQERGGERFVLSSLVRYST